VKVSRGRLIAALHLASTRAPGALALGYVVWELWGRAPRVVMQGVPAVLAVAAFVEFREALRLPKAAAGETLSR